MCTVLLPPGVNPIAVIKYIKYQTLNHDMEACNPAIKDYFLADSDNEQEHPLNEHS
jgi:hypothetical protein